MKRIGRLGVVCAAVLMMACGGNDVARDESGTVGTAGVSAGDRTWVEDSLSSGMAEVELGRTAQEKASNPEVKQFAEMMVRDHSKAGDELRRTAQQHSIQVEPQITDEHRDLMDRLSRLQAAEFDAEYMEAMVDSHENMIDHLQARASEDRFGDNKGAVQPERSDNPADAAINQWAANALPTARRHLDEARRIRDSLNNRTTR